MQSTISSWTFPPHIEVRLIFYCGGAAEKMWPFAGLSVAQRETLELSRRGLRQRLQEDQHARIFVRGDGRLHMVLEQRDGLGISGPAGGKDHERLHLLAPLRAGRTDHRTFLHRRMGIE